MKKPSLPTFEEEEGGFTEGRFRTLTFGDRTISYDAGMDRYDGDSGVRPRRIQAENDASDDQADDGIGTSDDDETSVSEESSSLKPRVIIKPDPSLIGQLMNFDEEEEYEDDEEDSGDVTDSTKSNQWQKTVAKDLLELSPRSLERRHSISLCTNPRKNSSSSNPPPTSAYNNPDGSKPPISSKNPYPEDESPTYQASEELPTCELQLEEVAHIRSVLTKAELETLPMDNNIRANVQRGKVCYVCLKTRFGLFYRGQKCDMCKQMVCANCYTKTRIPTDHFKSTPVFTLSPSLQGSSERDSIHGGGGPFTSLPPSVNARKLSPPCFINKTVGSAPSSPEHSRKGPISTISESIGASRQKYATLPKNNGRRISSVEARELEKQRLEGSLLNICTDCKDMVLQVIRASSSRRVKQPGSIMFSAA
eukprot:TRINITY_DN3480_c0_g1_i1.p1 TRINITY_DN3480_c0_g1~~TRINITY_DN3480_c0_g1_i1.p1  ORF type:complete len:422 (-),score=112.15 TRINITY_DN3480_c0_g1_i1:338-1603(-)